MNNSRVFIDNLSVLYRKYDSASRSIKTNLLKRVQETTASNFALKNFSLNVGPGEIVGIVGRNGSGKSTLVKAISGMVVPYEGRVITNGLITSIIELGAGLNHELTPEENVELVDAIFGLSKKESQNRTNRICDWAGISEYMNQPIKTLSSGMLARFSFSLVTDIKPDILILDEILSVGDIDFQEKSLKRTLELISGGTTVFLVSHSLETIREFSTKVIWIDAGIKLFEGDPELGLSRYRDSFNP
jgi:ABC-type polysaccharide/polyol phosphate transport system ATPase subunit